MKNISVVFFLLFASQLSSQCFMDRHNTSITDSWLSCFKSINPNPDRFSSHWIMYDLGNYYKLSAATIWNLNNPEFADHGVKTFTVDYATELDVWKTLGEFELEQAGVSSKYEGEQVFNFDDEFARYVLITSLDTYGDGSCAGFSELRIETSGVSRDDINIVMDQLIINPNPSNNIINISCLDVMCNASFQIYNAEGQLISEGEILNEKKIEVSSLPSGLYLCVLDRPFQRISQKFQVIH